MPLNIPEPRIDIGTINRSVRLRIHQNMEWKHVLEKFTRVKLDLHNLRNEYNGVIDERDSLIKEVNDLSKLLESEQEAATAANAREIQYLAEMDRLRQEKAAAELLAFQRGQKLAAATKRARQRGEYIADRVVADYTVGND